MQEYFVFLPPNSPNFNPIEETFSYIKYFLQDHDDLMQATDNPVNIIQSALILTTLQKNNALDGSMIVDTYEIAIATLVSHMIGYVTVMHMRCC